jgi:hypothetical protein
MNPLSERFNFTTVKNCIGDKLWYRNGHLHREGGPAIEGVEGTNSWWRCGHLHREDGPAVEYANGDKEWFYNGQLHRGGGPAVERANGIKQWWEHGKLIAEAPADAFAIEDEARRENRQRDIEHIVSAVNAGTAQPIAVSHPFHLKRAAGPFR